MTRSAAKPIHMFTTPTRDRDLVDLLVALARYAARPHLDGLLHALVYGRPTANISATTRTRTTIESQNQPSFHDPPSIPATVPNTISQPSPAYTLDRRAWRAGAGRRSGRGRAPCAAEARRRPTRRGTGRTRPPATWRNPHWLYRRIASIRPGATVRAAVAGDDREDFAATPAPPRASGRTPAEDADSYHGSTTTSAVRGPPSRSEISPKNSPAGACLTVRSRAAPSPRPPRRRRRCLRPDPRGRWPPCRGTP